MHPISTPRDLQPGTTLYHSAFGFAHIAAVDPEGVKLDWERQGAHLPQQVSFDNLARVYTLCPEDGFFHRALARPDALAQVLHDRPVDAIVWLLDDLDGPQRLRDVMDWLVGRELFTPKTFVRWWGTAEAALKADARVSIDGEWLHRTTDEATPLTQLEPDAVPPEQELNLDLPASDLTVGSVVSLDADTDDAVSPAPMTPVCLAAWTPAPAQFIDVAGHIARALEAHHDAGTRVHPTLESLVLHPDGHAEITPAATPPTKWPEPASDASDVRLAAVALLEAFLGRTLPHTQDPSDVLPHVRHRLPGLAPSALAPIVAAFHPDPAERPRAAAWRAQWEALARREAKRDAAQDARAMLRCGYDSHIGRVKLMLSQTNQDALWVGTRGAHGLFALADGISISDAGRGDMASWLTMQALSRLWQAAPIQRVDPAALLDRGLHLANRAICQHAKRAAGGDLTGRSPMGTTVTVAATRGNEVHLSWLGDSRAYLVSDDGVSQVTADDNVSGERFSSWCHGTLRRWHPDGHALVRYLGHFDAEQEPAPFPAHHARFTLMPDERLVICSDGVTDYLDAHEAVVAHTLAALTRGDDVHEAARGLVNEANRMGGGDNITALIVEVDAGTSLDW